MASANLRKPNFYFLWLPAHLMRRILTSLCAWKLGSSLAPTDTRAAQDRDGRESRSHKGRGPNRSAGILDADAGLACTRQPLEGLLPLPLFRIMPPKQLGDKRRSSSSKAQQGKKQQRTMIPSKNTEISMYLTSATAAMGINDRTLSDGLALPAPPSTTVV